MNPALHLTACLLGLLPPQATAQPARIQRDAITMGTNLRLDLHAASRPDAIAASEAALRAVEAVEARLSTWRRDSELARLNAAPVGRRVVLSTALRLDLERARSWSLATEGAFDPAIGALIDAWGLRGEGRVPTAGEIEVARRQSGVVRGLSLVGGGATRLRGGCCIDAGGFGKGAGLDAAVAELRRRGVRGTLDFGGQVAVVGCERDCDIADPDRRDRVVARVRVRDRSVATSGNGTRGRVVGGRRVGHLIDPRTGRPALDFGSVTVIAASAFDADCLSTALFVAGPEAALRWAAKRPGIDVVVVERASVDGAPVRIRRTASLAETFTPLLPDPSSLDPTR